jgi:integrase
MPLTATEVKNAKPGDKPRKLTDGAGMFLLINPNGSRYWRLKYRYAGREKQISLGVYDEVSLAEARVKREEKRKLLAKGIDPSQDRKQTKRALRTAVSNSFEAVARDWHDGQRARWTPGHADAVLALLKKDVFPLIGDRPLTEVTAPELLYAIRGIERRGAAETARKALRHCGAVFRFAIADGRGVHNPAADLAGALKAAPKVSNHAALSASELPEFLTALDVYSGHLQTRLGLRLILLTFVRTGELRGATWDEFDLDGATWNVPAERMKMKAPHMVPLSRQAVEALRELHTLTGRAQLLFPGQSNPRKPMSENTLLYAMYRMGYHSRATVHGFRATASTILNEQGWSPDVIERQLAHSERNKIRAAYNRAEYLDERRKMMQAWADYLDVLQAGADVVPIHSKGAA